MSSTCPKCGHDAMLMLNVAKEMKQRAAKIAALEKERDELRDHLGCEICDWEFKSLEPPTPTVLCPDCHGVYMVKYPSRIIALEKELADAYAVIEKSARAMLITTDRHDAELARMKPELEWLRAVDKAAREIESPDYDAGGSWSAYEKLQIVLGRDPMRRTDALEAQP